MIRQKHCENRSHRDRAVLRPAQNERDSRFYRAGSTTTPRAASSLPGIFLTLPAQHACATVDHANVICAIVLRNTTEPHDERRQHARPPCPPLCSMDSGAVGPEPPQGCMASSRHRRVKGSRDAAKRNRGIFGSQLHRTSIPPRCIEATLAQSDRVGTPCPPKL